jgi:APA family basic amino acid/polyamine antiporter
VLVYYAITNLCAIRLKPEERLYPAWTAYLGFAACLSLAFFVEWRVTLAGLGLIALGLIWKHFFCKQD